MTTAVFLELGAKRGFASALEWPGWCRSGKGEEGALAVLATYAERYAAVPRAAGVPFPAAGVDAFAVVERLPGAPGSMDFGVPDTVAAADARPLTAAEAERMAALVAACWTVFDQVAATVPEELRKGPRGGGRDRDKVIDHVLGAEASYARKLGIKQRQPVHDDAAAIATLRGAISAVLRAPSDGAPLVPNGWPSRYAARRIAWHVLDHAWEMEDRAEPGPP